MATKSKTTTTSTLPASLRMLTVPEVTEALRISRTTLWQLLRNGSIRSLKVGAGVRISEASLLAFIEGGDSPKANTIRK